MLVLRCFSATHFAYLLYCFSTLTAPKMLCKFSSTVSAALIGHDIITLHSMILAFSKVQVVLVVHHRICFDLIANVSYSIDHRNYCINNFRKNKKKRRDIPYGYDQSCWPLNFISEIPFLSNSCTALGSGTYNSFVAYFWPSVTNQ